MFNLKNLIYLTIFLLPSYLIKLNFFGLLTNVLEILIIIVVLWVILKRSFRNFLKLRFRIAIGMILAGLIIAAIINQNYAVGLGIIKGWFVLPALFAFAAMNIIQSEERKKIFIAFYWSAFTISLLGIVYFFLDTITYDGRLQVFFNSPNYLAMYLAPAMIIGSILFTENKKFYATTLLIILIAFYLTFSYAAWIAVAGALFAVEFLKKYNLPKNRICQKMADCFGKKAAVIFILIMVIALSQINKQKFSDLANFSERSSLSSRIMIWKSAGKMLSNNWVFGIGPGNFQEKYLEYQKYFPPYLEWAAPHPHSLYLAFWLQSGLVGLFGFLALLFFWLKDILKKSGNQLKYISLGIVIYILLHGLVDTTYFKNDLAVIFWLSFLAVI